MTGLIIKIDEGKIFETYLKICELVFKELKDEELFEINILLQKEYNRRKHDSLKT